MKHYLRFFNKTMVLLCAVFLCSNFSLHAQISGFVFRDFNANGQKDNSASFNEVNLAGITIRAFDSNGTQVGSTISANNGTYSFTGLTLPLRIEFSGFSSVDFSSASGTDNKSSIQFYTSASASANFGVNLPTDYCNSNPNLATTTYLASPGNNGDNGLAAIPVANSGTGAPGKVDFTAPYSTIGAVWGLSQQRESNSLFSSAFMKRHAAFGTGGTGAIYLTTNTNTPASSSTSLYINLQTLAGINTGADVHDTGNYQSDAIHAGVSPYDAVGKNSLGDMDISSDGKYLYTVNLFEKKIHRIFINNPAKAANALTSSDVTSWTIPSPCNAAQGQSRPWGLGIYQGKIYVGVVCDASISLDKNHLSATVYEMDPTTASGNFTQVLSFPLDYLHGVASGASYGREYWEPWRNYYYKNPASASCCTTNPQPVLSDIEFDIDGTMILGFLDRFSHQVRFIGPDEAGNGSLDPRLAGDVLRAGKCGASNTWTIENNASVCGAPATAGAGNTQGPGGGEFYYDEQFTGNHLEVSQGGLTMLRGSGQVIMSGMDPLAIYTSGFYYLNNKTGATDKRLELSNGSQFGKAGCIGDIEVLCNAAPIEIGNRVFSDSDRDGIQDANEVGIGSVTLELYEGSTKVGSTSTNSDGTYYFTNANVNQNGANGLKFNTNYEIRTATTQTTLTGKILTQSNVNSNNNDLIDSDASLSGSNAVVSFTTGSAGQNNHSYDFGFITCDVMFSLAQTNVTCNGKANGSISVSASNGATPYQYSKDDGVTFQSSNVFSNLSPSTYRIWVKDNLGCVKKCN
jgi:SdrD B-like domain/SprB repeat